MSIFAFRACDSTAVHRCQKAGAEDDCDDCAGPPRKCLRWSEGGARPPLTPTYKSRLFMGDVFEVRAFVLVQHTEQMQSKIQV